MLCAQRKVKCDRKSPCSNCAKAGAQCLSGAAVPRQRRRRFPERELLERLRHYEGLLSKNNIPFEPLHAPQTRESSKTNSPNEEHTGADRGNEIAKRTAEPSRPAPAPTETTQAKSFWRAMDPKFQYPYNGESQGSDDESDETDREDHVLQPRSVVKAWDELFNWGMYRSEHLLFCSRAAGVELSTLHPSQAQIFKLWQSYLENIDPILKLTHTPTLQARIIDAASDVTKIEPNLEALMFGIYCVTINSLDQDECRAVFGVSRIDAIRGYQLGAREALLNCGFLKSSNRECLTALHLYLISLKPETDPRALSCMLSTAVRIAQRIGIDSEVMNARHSALEAELRRRLWWSLVLFDSRIAEMTDFKTATLIPTWDCQTPRSVNDFSLRNEMKTPPAESSTTSEALFAVVRSKLGDFTRHSPSHLDFVNPVMKYIVRKPPGDSCSELEDIAKFESMLESKYLSQCDPQIPLHYMTIWWVRVFLAKTRFGHYLATRLAGPEHENSEQRDTGLALARTMLDSDTMLMRSDLIKGFRWLIYLHFPFPAYIHLVQDLKQRPLSDHADLAWQAMSDNCSARFLDIYAKGNPYDTRFKHPFFAMFSGLVLQAWTARAAVAPHAEPPLIITQIKQRLASVMEQETQLAGEAVGSDNGISYTSESMDLGNMGLHYSATDPFPVAPVQVPTSFNGMQWSWPVPNWGAMPEQSW